MKRCPKCGKNFPDDANFCPEDAGHLVPLQAQAVPSSAPLVDSGGHELLAGRFGLGAPLGGTRTGEVFEARDKQGGDCIVKIVAASVFATPLLLQRTERELQQLERLDSRHVARILGHGKRGDNLWFAMEKVAGTTIEKLVSQSGPMKEDRVVALLSKITAGLEEATRLGVVHRDLCPKNVLVGDSDRVALINFGVPLPHDSKLQGTIEFLAPEQLEGRPADQRSNLYGVAAIGYFMLTGRAPFVGSLPEILAAQRSGPPASMTPALSVSAGIQAVLTKALDAAPSKRHMTLRQFLEDLQSPPPANAASSPSTNGDMNKTLLGMVAMGAHGPEAVVQTPTGQPGPGAPSTAGTEGPGPQTVSGQIGAGGAPASSMPITPPSAVQPSPPMVAAPKVASTVDSAAPGGKNKGKSVVIESRDDKKKKSGFRETMWFKKGELDEAAAAAVLKKRQQDALASDKADEMAIDERYKDDGSLSTQDQERLSLRTGATMMMEAVSVPAGAVTNHVSEHELVSEMRGGNKLLVLAGIGIVVVLGILIALLA